MDLAQKDTDKKWRAYQDMAKMKSEKLTVEEESPV